MLFDIGVFSKVTNNSLKLFKKNNENKNRPKKKKKTPHKPIKEENTVWNRGHILYFPSIDVI